ncbi:MAG: glycosyltransferase family 4 protein [Lachnospiraceae bacterium]|nr:glycosyltransferase family 4 protein [Lachnospiraceae bacterium]
MVSNKLKNVKIFFFGAGKIGRYWIKQSKTFGMVPKGILDNNKDLWGTVCDDIVIYDPDIIKTLYFDYIFVTCSREKEIIQQLLNMGAAEKKIITSYHDILNHLLFCAAGKMKFSENTVDIHDKYQERKILFDLYNGMVLGGVESWSYATARRLYKKNYCGMYLTTDAAGPAVTDETYPAYMLKYYGVEKEKEKIEMCVEKIKENLPCTIICNFPQHIFWSACIAKQRFPEQIRLIAVQHSDDFPYYSAYSLWQQYIDRCMVISSRIKQKLLSHGMEQIKMDYLEWDISCKEKVERIMNEKKECLQIGYAGRVTVTQKRADLLIELSKKLRKKNIDFQMNIAGTGDYSEILDRRIREENLQESVILTGYLDRKNIPDFWSRQDIMVSCSECEGHSISQSEAMAEGAVPVITDVSGARDDVTNGYNGYVVDVGDIDALADRIQELYLDRDKRNEMSMRAHDTICKRQKNMDQTVFWDNLIEKVWQE